jgi:hypothetical protein
MNRLESFDTPARIPTMTQVRGCLTEPERIPPVEIVEGRYLVRFARTDEEIDAALRLRFEVFNLELGEGLDAADLSVCWWGDMTFIKHLFGLLRLREINATLIFGLDRIREEDRKALASKLHAAVKREFIPVIRSGKNGPR